MSESVNIEELDPRDDADWATPIEDLEPVELDDELPDRAINIGSLLDVGLYEELIQFLRKNLDMFVWCHKDLPGIDPQIMSHKLHVNLEFRPVKQKRRAMASKR